MEKEAVIIYVDGEPMFNVIPRMAAWLVDFVCEWEHAKVITLEKVRVHA